ncbi:MAG: ActS/PrrB/RegB family redox-sensitive histidine kinase [Alphaproteobacteria bacterium]|nr:ActS/PrrB/RegB family redox-sensitive histidine kinase [Alphaproteobacteria bacterium]
MPIRQVGGGAGPSGQAVPVQLRTLVLIRWVAAAGQLAILLLVHYGLGFRLPLVEALTLVALPALLNFFVVPMHPRGAVLRDQTAALYLAFDLVQLAGLLALTGGLANPFALLLLAPVTVSATILSRQSTAWLCLIAIMAATALAFWHLPLPWAGEPPVPAASDMAPARLLALWVALAIAILFIAGYVSRVAADSRRMASALGATQLALAREQRLSALGGLAAALAHELGTPLATIAVVAREIAHDLPPGSPLGEDAALLLSQTDRCREIIQALAQAPEADGGAPYERLPLTQLVAEAAAPHARADVALTIEGRAEGEGVGTEPVVARSPEAIHGLRNLVGNALEFARREVRVSVAWRADSVEIVIADDGPGFPTHLAGRLGEPYLSTRAGDGRHMGLGIFIARTLLARTGATLSFGNRPGGGAELVIGWPRAALDQLGRSRNEPATLWHE